MVDFVLVHGSGQNASCWSRLRRVLEARGHGVATPDLPKQTPDWTLEKHAEVIASAIAGPQSVVVAHSLSGAFLPLVPRMAECGRLVFLAAVIPEAGRSVREQFTEDPAMFSPEWIEAGPRWFDRSEQASLAREFLFHDCDEPTVSWALDTLEPIDTRQLVTQPSPFERWPEVPVASIVATEDRTLSPDWGRRTCRRVLGREPIEIVAGHCPQVSQPDAIARILERIATGEDSGPPGRASRVSAR